jgi:glycosyltransferase involved in cell wall biosynthesis
VLNHAIAQKRYAGLDVEIITIAHKTSQDFVTEIEGIRVHFLRTYHPWRAVTGFLLDRWRMARYARRLNPQLIHAHGTEDVYALAAQWTRRPYVITAQGLMFQILPTLRHIPWPMRFAALTERHALRRAKVMIAKSDYVRQGLAAAYPHLDLHVIPNTYQQELDQSYRPAPTDHLRRTGSKLAFIGTVDERKGVHLIAEAMPQIKAAVPDTSLTIIGNAANPTGYAAEQIVRLRETLGDNLILAGRKSALELFELLRPCTALLAPSLEEMFGNQLIEGLMCGLHGIVTENTALAENVRRFGNGTVVPQRDAAALAAATIQALQNPPTDSTCESARQAIRDYMGPAAVAAKHQALYNRILNQSDQSHQLDQSDQSHPTDHPNGGTDG